MVYAGRWCSSRALVGRMASVSAGRIAVLLCCTSMFWSSKMVKLSVVPNLSYSHPGQEFSDHVAELRKHPQVDPGSCTFWVRGTSSVSAGHP